MYVLVETDGKYRVYDSFSMKLNTELQFYELESSLEYKLRPQWDILKNKDIHGVPMKMNHIYKFNKFTRNTAKGTKTQPWILQTMILV